MDAPTLISGLRKAGQTPRVVTCGVEAWWDREGDLWRLYFGSSDSIFDYVRSCQAWSAHGYHWGYTSEIPHLLSTLPPAMVTEGSQVVIAGHSMGGAVAVALARVLLFRSVDVQEVVTVGQPKLARAWAKPLPIKTRRYVCGWDPVPLWPPGYVHQVPPILLPSPNLDKPRLTRGFFDHRLTSYERTL